MRFGLIGEKLGHSFSKKVHSLLGDYPYELKELSPEELSVFLRQKDFEGINVTIPYKQAVIPFLDEISDEVKEIGACNCIVNRDGKLWGFNTDAYGLESLIHYSCVLIKGKKCAILGTGGTSKTANYVLKKLGAADVFKVSRTGKEGALTYENIPDDIEVIVNTTPCGMFPDVEDSPLDLSRFPHLIGVFDAVYNPLRSELVSQAKRLGVASEGGLYMLVGQAVRASELFFEKKYPEDVLEKVYETLLHRDENIVLTGMPTSGKTTIGKLLAQQMGREFVDVDLCIQERIKGDIPSYFAKFGEKAFRDEEEKVIAELSKRTGVIIATGGGSILRERNIQRLKRNGRVFFLNRSLNNLIVTSDRPLSSDRDALKKRYEERFDIYLWSADVVVDGNRSPKEIAKEIEGAFE